MLLMIIGLVGIVVGLRLYFKNKAYIKIIDECEEVNDALEIERINKVLQNAKDKLKDNKD